MDPQGDNPGHTTGDPAAPAAPQPALTTADGPDVGAVSDSPAAAASAASPASAVSAAELLPPSWLLVVVSVSGREHDLEQLVQVVARDTFCDLCLKALRDAGPTAPRAVGGLKGFMAVGSTEVEIQNPDSNAAGALRSFPRVRRLRFEVEEAAQVRGATVRGVRVARQQRWQRRFARIAINLAKLVLVVEAAVLLRRAVHAAGWQLRAALTGRDDEGSGTSGSGGVGSETDEALEAVADYVTGRGSLARLQRLDRRAVRGALDALDTQVLEELEVSDVPETKRAVGELLQQLRREEGGQPAEGQATGGAAAAAAAAAALATAPEPLRPAEDRPAGRPGFGPSRTAGGGAAAGGSSRG